jgi:hypothetical protein
MAVSKSTALATPWSPTLTILAPWLCFSHWACRMYSCRPGGVILTGRLTTKEDEEDPITEALDSTAFHLMIDVFALMTATCPS